MTEVADSQTYETTNERAGYAWVIWSTVALLLAYPLSIGPVAKLYSSRPSASVPSALRTFYAPLGRAYDANKQVKKALDWYVSLWGAHL